MQINQHLRNLAFLVMLGLYMLTIGHRGVLAMVGIQDFCDDPEVCGPLEECNKPCWVDLFENTCGGYGGTPVDPVRGNCIGTCTDGYCNDFNGEDDETCYDDCGDCGDETCSTAEEYGPLFCCQDCNVEACNTYQNSCEDSLDCSSGLSCNEDLVCCTSTSVGTNVWGCSACYYNEDCVYSNPNYYCVTKGGVCSGVS
jgi:hypothetical protein